MIDVSHSSLKAYNDPAIQSRFSLDYDKDRLLSNKDYRDFFSKVENILKAPRSQKERIIELRNLAHELCKEKNMSAVRSYSHNYRILLFAIYADNLMPSDISSLLLWTYSDMLRMPIPVEKLNNENPCRKVTRFVVSLFKSYFQKPSGQMIYISHGGGEKYLREFFENQHKGYAQEAEDRGIFFSVNPPNQSNERDWAYAKRTPLKYFDNPSVIRGWIDSSYLCRVNHNSYEAVLSPENVSKFIQGSRESIDLLKLPFDERVNYITDVIPAPQLFGNAGHDHLWNAVTNCYSENRLAKLKHCLDQITRQVERNKRTQIFN